MIKLQLINAVIIYDTACVTWRLFRKSFNCRYNPRMDYAFCLLTLKSYEKWRSHYLVLHATSMTKFYLTVYYFYHSLAQMSFIYCHLNIRTNLSRPWRFSLAYIVAVSFIVGGNRRNSPTYRKSLTNFIT